MQESMSLTYEPASEPTVCVHKSFTCENAILACIHTSFNCKNTSHNCKNTSIAHMKALYKYLRFGREGDVGRELEVAELGPEPRRFHRRLRINGSNYHKWRQGL